MAWPFLAASERTLLMRLFFADRVSTPVPSIAWRIRFIVPGGLFSSGHLCCISG
jgi:hypothetical protein